MRKDSSGMSRLARWFVYSGCLGVLVALVLLTVASIHHRISPSILLTLFPSSIVGIADPSTFIDKVLVLSVEFGGNFILYGVLGLLVGLVFQALGRAIHH